jgi:hypothetical protein
MSGHEKFAIQGVTIDPRGTKRPAVAPPPAYSTTRKNAREFAADADPGALRKGKWTVEEEAYAGKLITEFQKGTLPLAQGTTLRAFLSSILNCDPMRISKKFAGDSCIGKQVFKECTADTLSNMQLVQELYEELTRLEAVRVACSSLARPPARHACPPPTARSPFAVPPLTPRCPCVARLADLHRAVAPAYAPQRQPPQAGAAAFRKCVDGARWCSACPYDAGSPAGA